MGVYRNSLTGEQHNEEEFQQLCDDKIISDAEAMLYSYVPDDSDSLESRLKYDIEQLSRKYGTELFGDTLTYKMGLASFMAYLNDELSHELRYSPDGCYSGFMCNILKFRVVEIIHNNMKELLNRHVKCDWSSKLVVYRNDLNALHVEFGFYPMEMNCLDMDEIRNCMNISEGFSVHLSLDGHIVYGFIVRDFLVFF